MRRYTEEQWAAWRRQGAADKAYNVAVTLTCGDCRGRSLVGEAS